MGIFNNKNVINTTIPLVENFDIISYGYGILKDMSYDSFKISLEFNQSMYTGLKYDNIDILNEGFTEFFEKAAEFFRNLAKKIIDFTTKYMKYFVSFFQDFKKFLDNNKEYLRSLDVNFTYEGHEFEFPKNTPDISKVHDIVSSYNSEISRIDDMKFTDVGKIRDEFANETNKNKIRASIINVGDNEITEDKFNSRSKEVFRKSKEAAPITVNKLYIDMIINTYSDMVKLLDDTKRDKNKIVRLLSDLEFFFTKKAKVTYINNQKTIKTSTLDSSENDFKKTNDVTSDYTDEKIKILNTYFDVKFRESRFISNCVTTVYMDKINAINECMKQYKAIIRKALVDTKEKSSEKKDEVKK